LSWDGATINGAGSFLDRHGHGYDRYRDEPETLHRGQWPQLAGTPCDYPMGCGMVVRLRGLEDVWPLDERLPKWHDDSELGIRVQRLGYQTIFWPRSRVYHWAGHANPANDRVRHWMSEEARLRLLIKYYPWPVVARNIFSLALHGISGTRRQLSWWRETRCLFARVRQDWADLAAMRREWTSPMTIRSD
jgi:GT2 family glycosyltransferase